MRGVDKAKTATQRAFMNVSLHGGMRALIAFFSSIVLRCLGAATIVDDLSTHRQEARSTQNVVKSL